MLRTTPTTHRSSSPTPCRVRHRSLVLPSANPRSWLLWLRPIIWSFAYGFTPVGLACVFTRLTCPLATPYRSPCLWHRSHRTPRTPSRGHSRRQLVRVEHKHTLTSLLLGVSLRQALYTPFLCLCCFYELVRQLVHKSSLQPRYCDLKGFEPYLYYKCVCIA